MSNIKKIVFLKRCKECINKSPRFSPIEGFHENINEKTKQDIDGIYICKGCDINISDEFGKDDLINELYSCQIEIDISTL